MEKRWQLNKDLKWRKQITQILKVPIIEEKERANLKVVSWEHDGLFENNREAGMQLQGNAALAGEGKLSDKLKEALGDQSPKDMLYKCVGFYCV